jgi:hypothetical protein
VRRSGAFVSEGELSAAATNGLNAAQFDARAEVHTGIRGFVDVYIEGTRSDVPIGGYSKFDGPIILEFKVGNTLVMDSAAKSKAINQVQNYERKCNSRTVAAGGDRFVYATAVVYASLDTHATVEHVAFYWLDAQQQAPQLL